MSGKCPPLPPTSFEDGGYYVAAKAISKGVRYENYVPAMCAAYGEVTGKYLNNTQCALYMSGATRAFMDIPTAMQCYQEYLEWDKNGGK